MTRIAYFDCFSGISGDMTLGALIDLGVEPARIEAAIRSLGLAELRLTAQTVKKCGFRAVKVEIEHPPEHAHRHLHHITEMIDRADEVSEPAKALARNIFTKLAEAEAKVHGSTLERVHFHEVGAIDSIADIVGTAVAIEALGIERFAASPVPTGTGNITIAHGRVAVPAPATAELLRGVLIAPSDVAHELTTPTGAAILKATTQSFGPIPEMSLTSVGYGAGTLDLENQANVLRVLVGETTDEVRLGDAIETDRIVVLETNLDDTTPQQLADCADRLLAAGALDVLQTPCLMKKGRAGIMLTVLSASSRVALLESIIFTHSSSIGIRRQSADRHKLARQSVTVETAMGPVRGKLVKLPSGELRLTVEDDDARALASANQVSAERVRQVALEVWRRTHSSDSID